MTLRPANSSLINRRNYAENRHGSASMKRSTAIDVQHAHFYDFKGEAQYLHRHTGVLTIEVADTMNDGVNGATETYEPGKTKDRCPLCGIELNENGVCPKCGYKK